ncbi:MAG TPA: hypothetical protein VKR58_05680 [Aquella sp.]|nr:hypothetical protein [Aquella sp.]
MNYANDFGFDVIEYVRKLRNVGVSQEIAEVQGQELSHMIKIVANEVKTEIKQELHSDNLATKNDIQEVKSEIQLVKSELQSEIQVVKNEIQVVKNEIREVELRLQLEIANTKNELIKWVLGIGITASIVTCGAMFTMLKLLIH